MRLSTFCGLHHDTEQEGPSYYTVKTSRIQPHVFYVVMYIMTGKYEAYHKQHSLHFHSITTFSTSKQLSGLRLDDWPYVLILWENLFVIIYSIFISCKLTFSKQKSEPHSFQLTRKVFSLNTCIINDVQHFYLLRF